MITQFPASKHTRENCGKNYAPPPSISMFFQGGYQILQDYQNIKIEQMKEANTQNSYRSCFKILKKQVYFSFLSRIQIDDKTTSFTFLNLGTFLSIVSHSIQCFSKKFLQQQCAAAYIFSLCFCKKCRLFHMKDFTNFICFFTVVNQALQHCDDHLMQLKNLVSDLHRVLICSYSFSCCDFFRRHLHFRQAPHQLQEQPKIKRQINSQDRRKNY